MYAIACTGDQLVCGDVDSCLIGPQADCRRLARPAPHPAPRHLAGRSADTEGCYLNGGLDGWGERW